MQVLIRAVKKEEEVVILREREDPAGAMIRLIVEACLLASLVALVPAGSDEKEDVGTVIGIDLGTTYSWYANQ